MEAYEIISGRVGTEPESRSTAGGHQVASFRPSTGAPTEATKASARASSGRPDTTTSSSWVGSVGGAVGDAD